MICSLLSRGLAELPVIYREGVVASVARPRRGVEVALLTHTHLVETCRGLVVRSVLLKHSAKVRDLRLVMGDLGDWRYLVVRDGLVQFLCVASLRLVREYDGVETVEVGDYRHSGQLLVKIFFRHGGVVITDGGQEYELIDLDTSMEGEREEQQSNEDVANVINERIEHISEAVEAARAEVETKKKMIEETLTNLLLDSDVSLDSEVVLGETEKKEEEEKLEAREVLRVSEDWVRVITTDFPQVVVGMRLLCRRHQPVTDLSLNLSPLPDKPLQYTSSLLSLSSPASVTRLAWQIAGGHSAYLVSILPLSSLTSTSSLSASVSYTCRDLNMITRTVHIDLQPDLFLSSSVLVDFSGKREDTLSLLSLSLLTKTEALKVRTELGLLTTFTEHLQENNFFYSSTICSYVLISPGNILHHSVVSFSPVTSQEAVLRVTGRDLTILGLLVTLLRKFLPADVTFSRMKESLS